jgi:chromosome segregation ATPase
MTNHSDFSRNEKDEAVEQSSSQPTLSSKPMWWIAATLAAVIVAVIFISVMHYQANAELIAQLEDTNRLLKGVEARTAALEANFVALQGISSETADQLTKTADSLKNTRWQASKLAKDQAAAKEQLTARLEEHKSQLEAISGEVGEVKEEVATTQDSLEDTRSTLSRAMGDLGVQSGLIARNHEELEELKRRGERDYFEFDLAKSKEFTRVGNVSVRLNKTDTKRNKFTLTLLSSDRIIEKKDKTLLEPVQFYTEGKGQLLELVVFEVNRNRVVGYLSVPKNQMARHSPTN